MSIETVYLNPRKPKKVLCLLSKWQLGFKYLKEGRQVDSGGPISFSVGQWNG